MRKNLYKDVALLVIHLWKCSLVFFLFYPGLHTSILGSSKNHLIYRKPLFKHENHPISTEESMYKIYSENKPTILMGDINIDIMSDKKDKLQESWISLTTNIQLNQIIKEPTRVTNTSETLIDHIYVSDDLPVLYSSPIKYSISDHFPVFAVFKMTNIDYNKMMVAIKP